MPSLPASIGMPPRVKHFGKGEGPPFLPNMRGEKACSLCTQFVNPETCVRALCNHVLCPPCNDYLGSLDSDAETAETQAVWISPCCGPPDVGCLALYNPGAQVAAAQPQASKRGPGRPQGSKNKVQGGGEGESEAVSQSQCETTSKGSRKAGKIAKDSSAASTDSPGGAPGVEDWRRKAKYWSMAKDGVRLIMCLLDEELHPKFVNMEYILHKEQLDTGQPDKKVFWQLVFEKFFNTDWKPEALFRHG